MFKPHFNVDGVNHINHRSMSSRRRSYFASQPLEDSIKEGQNHDGKEYLALQFTASVTGGDVSIIGEISDDLESWDNSTVLSEISLSKDLSTKQMTLRSDTPIVIGKTEQIRLRVVLDK